MYPHFLCIGAQKAATSWLNKVLRSHPDIWLLPVKSTRYFNNPSTAPAYKVALFGGMDKDRWRRLARNRLKKMLRHKDYKNLAWFYRFYFFERTDEWYASLFTPAADQIAGELTPAYARLKRQTVARIYDLMPETKIIYLLRNPVARTWSNAAMHIEKKYKQSIDEVDDHLIVKIILNESNHRHSDYLKTLDLWGEYFGEGQIHVAFFDQLVEDPKNFLKDIFRFLGVDDSDEYVPNTVGVKRNIGQYPTISDKYLELLASTYLPNLEKLHRRFNNQYTAQWLNTLTPHAKFLRGQNFGQFRLDEANQQFEAWMTHNPHKKFADYYVEKVMARLNKGKTHPTLGRNLKGGRFEGSGDSILNKLIDEGLNPGHVCVD
ncbi:MAG: sulfotransferase, partial [Bacteroidetes bacterium]|nr:sulfotransferase [Bacteroidota bacterium]